MTVDGRPLAQFDARQSDRLAVGCADIGLPFARGRGTRVIATPDGRGLIAEEAKKNSFVVAESDLLTEAAFVVRLRRQLAATFNPESAVVIDVPGFYRSHDASLIAAAQVYEDSNRSIPVVVFTWPTADSLTDYVASADRAANSVDQFVRLVRLVYRAGARRIHFRAHGMGIRIVPASQRFYAKIGFEPVCDGPG
jgi:esterase/lipase superfamily enzyme